MCFISVYLLVTLLLAHFLSFSFALSPYLSFYLVSLCSLFFLLPFSAFLESMMFGGEVGQGLYLV